MHTDRQTLRDFYRWLDSATEESLMQRKHKLNELLPKLTDTGVIDDAEVFIRLIDEELIARTRS